MNIKSMNKKLKNMFPEYRELMQILAQENPHFAKLMEDHNELDREITQIEQDPVKLLHEDVEGLKRRKLKLKDELYQILQSSSVESLDRSS